MADQQNSLYLRQLTARTRLDRCGPVPYNQQPHSPAAAHRFSFTVNKKMPSDELNETKAMWDNVAADWLIQVGHDGDNNRRLNSDPVLWQFAGEVKGLKVLDAGCGTGYLTNQLHKMGAQATGIDFSPRMIEIAAQNYPELDFRVDSCAELKTLPDEIFDLVVSNYVLMDAPDLEGTMRAFNRVLRPNGAAVVIFSHPCFPQDWAQLGGQPSQISYHWPFSYFERQKCVGEPWAHFTEKFIWFHRPLSDYWKAFTAAGFQVLDFEEPRVTPDRYHLATNLRSLENSKTRPYSVAFKLQKKHDVKNP